jgi:ketosteroid isomerase-like protein
MGQAREVMDRFTEAVLTNKDLKAAAELFAENVVVRTPDRGELRGRDQLVEYARQFLDAFPDVRIDWYRKHESGNAAIDESIYVGTNTGPLLAPTGEVMAPTGRSISLRSCEVATVENGVITEYNFYYDQMELLGHLGLLDNPAAAQ